MIIRKLRLDEIDTSRSKGLADTCCNETSLQARKPFKSQVDKVILPRHCAGPPFIGAAPPPRPGGPFATVSVRVGRVARRRHPPGRSASSKQSPKVLCKYQTVESNGFLEPHW